MEWKRKLLSFLYPNTEIYQYAKYALVIHKLFIFCGVFLFKDNRNGRFWLCEGKKGCEVCKKNSEVCHFIIGGVERIHEFCDVCFSIQ